MSGWKPQAKTLALIGAAEAVIDEAEADGYKPTLRRVFYALVAADNRGPLRDPPVPRRGNAGARFPPDPVPLGRSRSSVRGDPTARSFPETQPIPACGFGKPSEIASEERGS